MAKKKAKTATASEPTASSAATPKGSPIVAYMKAKEKTPDHPVTFADLIALGGNQTWG